MLRERPAGCFRASRPVHDVCFPLYVEADEIYNLACPASPIHYQFDPVQTWTAPHPWTTLLAFSRTIRSGRAAAEFDALRDAFEREIEPRGIIEQMYVHDISSIVWEILRLRRCKAVIINSAFRSALEQLLVQLRGPSQSKYYAEGEAQALAHAWFTDQEVKKQV
jgi:hypothetical protein